MQNSPPRHASLALSPHRSLLDRWNQSGYAKRILSATTALLTLCAFGSLGNAAAKADPATHLSVTCAAATRTTDTLVVTVTALDQNNNVDTTNGDNITWSSTDPQALTYDNNLSNGVQTFYFYLGTLGTQTLTATDTNNSDISGTSNSIEVTLGDTQQIDVVTPATTVAGTPFTFTVSASDGFGNPTPAYAGTLSFSSTDGAAVLPASSTLTNGTGTFTATLNTQGTQRIFARDFGDGELGGSSNDIEVTGLAVVTHFALVVPGTATAGVPVSATIQALDASNNVVPTYNTLVSTTQTDPRGSSPPFVSMKNGIATANVTFRLARQWTLSVTDTNNPKFTDTQNITVIPNIPARFRVGSRQSVISGKPFGFNLQAQDLYGNFTVLYNGLVHFTSSDPGAICPPDTQITDGVGSLVGTLVTLGPQTFTATDIGGRSSVTGTSDPNVVQPGPAVLFKVDVPTSAIAGVPVNVTVTVLDSEYNVSRFYTGIVHFTSNDPKLVLPADMPLTFGTATFSATFKTAVRDFITATDTVTPAIKGTSLGTNVVPNNPAKFGFSAPQAIVAGRQFGFYVSAQDAYGNVTPSYSGRVGFTSSDPSAVLPGIVSLVNGISGQKATFMTLGSQTLTATDTASPSMTGTSDPISSTRGTR